MEVGCAELLKLWEEGVLPEERISLVKNRVALRAVGVVWLMKGSTNNWLVLCGAKKELSLWEILKAWESLVCTEVGNKVVVSVFDIVDSCEMEDVRERVLQVKSKGVWIHLMCLRCQILLRCLLQSSTSSFPLYYLKLKGKESFWKINTNEIRTLYTLYTILSN